MDDKTNAMRLLDGRRLSYMHRSYPCKEAVSGVEAAKLMQLDPAMVYKTLVTVGKFQSALCICDSGRRGTRSQKSR